MSEEERHATWRALLKDMHQTLLSEIGARSIYDHLSRRVRDAELQRLLVELNASGAHNVETLRTLMSGMGGRPRRTSFRRRAMARALALASVAIGTRPVLRVCQHAEDTVSRWYREYAVFFLHLGDTERAEVCRRLSTEKGLRSRVLSAWVSNAARR